jgi:hypothetical protein
MPPRTTHPNSHDAVKTVARAASCCLFFALALAFGAVACSGGDYETRPVGSGAVTAICSTSSACSGIVVSGGALPEAIDEAMWQACGICEYNLVLAGCSSFLTDNGDTAPTLSSASTPGVAPCFLGSLLLCQQAAGLFASTPSQLMGLTSRGLCEIDGPTTCFADAVSNANGDANCPSIVFALPDGGIGDAADDAALE